MLGKNILFKLKFVKISTNTISMFLIRLMEHLFQSEKRLLYNLSLFSLRNFIFTFLGKNVTSFNNADFAFLDYFAVSELCK